LIATSIFEIEIETFYERLALFFNSLEYAGLGTYISDVAGCDDLLCILVRFTYDNNLDFFGWTKLITFRVMTLAVSLRLIWVKVIAALTQ